MPIQLYLRSQVVGWIGPKDNSLSTPVLKYKKRDMRAYVLEWQVNPCNFQCEKLQTFEGDLVTKQDNLKGSIRNTRFPLLGCLSLEEEIKNTYLTTKGRTVRDILENANLRSGDKTS